jgi:hypothetical protein
VDVRLELRQRVALGFEAVDLGEQGGHVGAGGGDEGAVSRDGCARTKPVRERVGSPKPQT